MVGQGGVVSGVALCGPDGLRFEPRLGARFSAHPFRPPLAPTQLLYSGYRVTSPGVKQLGRGAGSVYTSVPHLCIQWLLILV